MTHTFTSLSMVPIKSSKMSFIYLRSMSDISSQYALIALGHSQRFDLYFFVLDILLEGDEDAGLRSTLARARAVL